jgi:prophage maintenance system killer protein
VLNGTRVTGGRGPAAVGAGQRVGEGHVGPVARPQATAFGEDAYPDMLTKAAALLESVVNNHALVDGNKRLGWLATAVFLELNGVRISRPTTTSTRSSWTSPAGLRRLVGG